MEIIDQLSSAEESAKTITSLSVSNTRQDHRVNLDAALADPCHFAFSYLPWSASGEPTPIGIRSEYVISIAVTGMEL